VKRFAALALVAASAACGPSWKDVSRSLDAPPNGEPMRDRQRTYYDREHTQPRTEVSLLLYGDGRNVKDGLERSWRPDGKLEFERSWRDDAPDGWWRTWWPDGTPRFEYCYAPEPSLMRWWHSSGALSSRDTGGITGMVVSGSAEVSSSSSSSSIRSASTDTCCFSSATLVTRGPERAWRKKVR